MTMAAASMGFGPVPDVTPTADRPPDPPLAAEQRLTPAEARDRLMSGDYGAAAEAYEALRREAEHAPEAELGLARCRLQTGEYQEGIRGLVENDATRSPDWHYLMAKLRRLVGEYDDALEHARAAVAIDADHAAARLLLADTLELIGRRDEAVENYQWFERQLVGRADLPRDADWVMNAAVGFMRFTILTQISESRDQQVVVSRTKHVLHEMLQRVYEQLDRTWWPARIAAADLLREKYNNDPEDGCVADYEAALRINPNLPQAQVGLGEVALQNYDFEEVERRVELALDTNPNHAPALHLLARKLIVERRYEEAEEVCGRSLSINPNDIEALSLMAAAQACRYDRRTMDRTRARVEAINPRCARLHRELGDALGGIRQYAESEKEYRRAIELEPADANARTELGMMYMQWGVEDEARKALERAWELDPFNERTKFTLELLDSLQKFATHESAHFIIRHDAGQDPGLGAYVAPYLEEIYSLVTGDYAARPEHKTIVEIFPTQREFAVRITGKPWIHTIGACTGRIIALASPRKSTQLMGPYDWARVLKHEFTHTVTLAATGNRIPHWFTEGLAVAQEDLPRDFDWSALLAEAVRRNRLFTLDSIDWGFIRPRRPNDRQLAYAQSEWMCEYLTDRFGYHAINDMLARFQRGQTARDVFIEQLGVEPEAFDRDFASWAKTEVVRWGFDTVPPEDAVTLRRLAEEDGADAPLLGRLARAEWDADEPEQARVAAGRALELDAKEANALNVLAQDIVERMEACRTEAALVELEGEAIPLLERLAQADLDGWLAPKHLALIALHRKEYDRAARWFEQLQRLCPRDPASWSGLAAIYLERGDEERALPQLLDLARTDTRDADVPAKIGGIFRRKNQLRESQYWYRRALYIDPFSVEFHQALGDTCMQAGDAGEALREYLALTSIRPDHAEHFERAAFAAHKLGDHEQARRLAEQAVARDASSAASALLR